MVRGIGLRALIVAAGGPALVVVIIEAAVLVAALFGDHPRWPDMRLNLSEAAAVRDNAEVVRLIERGEDPNMRRPVRPPLLGRDSEILAIPLEAAVSIRRTDLLSLLFENGAQPSPTEWRHLRCAAETLEYGDVVEFLDARRPAGSVAMCSGDERLW